MTDSCDRLMLRLTQVAVDSICNWLIVVGDWRLMTTDGLHRLMQPLDTSKFETKFNNLSCKIHHFSMRF